MYDKSPESWTYKSRPNQTLQIQHYPDITNTPLLIVFPGL